MHMLKKHKSYINALLIVGFGIVVLAIIGKMPTRTQATNGGSYPPCGSSAQIINPGDGQNVFGVIPLEVFSSITDPIDEVKLFSEDDGLGNANPVAGFPNRWRHNWDTSLYPNGNRMINALVRYSNDFDCVTDPIFINIDNSTTSVDPDLRIEVIPDDSWSGPTNVSFPFEVVAILVDDNTNSFISDVTDNTNFTWTTTIGAISAGGNGHIGNFFSGPGIGIGQVLVTANYGGDTEQENIQINVFDASNPPPDSDYDDYIGENDSSEEESNEVNDEIKVIRPEDPNRVDYSLAQCLLDRLGEEQYKTLLEDGVRLSPEQFENSYGCFSTRRFVIPSSLSPVDPSVVLDLRIEDRIVKIVDRKNVPAPSNPDLEAIEFTGIATPDRNILIYIFSEPLVLSGQTDSDGRWTYTLEDPLEPGDHEAYVLVETDEGYVRSSSFGFQVAQATVTEDNPNGYSLALVGDSDSTALQNYYLYGLGLLVLFASIVLARFVWFRKQPAQDSSMAQAVNAAKDVVDAPESVQSTKTHDPNVEKSEVPEKINSQDGLPR